jgi:hypothetical protein
MEMLRTSRRTLLSVGLAAMLAILPTTAAVAQAQGASGRPTPLPVPIAATQTAAGVVSGTLSIQRFASRNGAVVAIGTFAGIVTDTAGQTTAVLQPVVVPVITAATTTAAAAPTAAATTASCEILHLVLGPLDLNLLGLQVHLNQVVLDITAVPGAGNLLGNLLCAIAGLLDGGAPSLAQLVTLLNNLLAALGSL